MYVWLFTSSSNKVSLILFSAIIPVFLSNADNFWNTYKEKWHCCRVSTDDLQGSFNIWMQVESSSSLLVFVDLFKGLVLFLLEVESDDKGEAPDNDASRFMLNSLSEMSELGVWRLCSPSDRVYIFIFSGLNNRTKKLQFLPVCLGRFVILAGTLTRFRAAYFGHFSV